MQRAKSRGLDISAVHSVASVVANARQVYRSYEEAMTTTAWQGLVAVGANLQQPSWASTGPKDPAADPTTYVAEPALPATVTTAPLATMLAAASAPGRPLLGRARTGAPHLASESLRTANGEQTARLLDEGVTKLQDSSDSVVRLLSRRLRTGTNLTRSHRTDDLPLFTSADP